MQLEGTRHEILNTVVSLGLLIFAPTFAGAATYYVAPNGSNSNTGTQAAPFATLQKAHDVAVAGDTIYMRGGTYKFAAQTTLTKDGTSATNRITISKYQSEVPVIDAVNQPSGTHPIRFNGASWWHIKGLEIKNGAEGGICLSTSTPNNNNIIEQNHIHHNGAKSTTGDGKGISVITGSNNLILNNDVHHNANPLRGYEDADGIQFFNAGPGNVLRGNRVWNNSDDGVDVWNTPSMLIENNWIWMNGKNDAGSPIGGDGGGFKLGGNGTGDGGHMVRNNVVWNNLAIGFNQNSADNPITLYNNTAWNNGGGSFGFWNKANIYRNNISLGKTGSVSGSATFNSWNLPVTVSTADFQSMDDTCARGPRQADGSLPNCGFLRLAAGSDLIDKGTNVGIRYSGSAPDLGAFEYGGTAPPPPPSPPTPPPPPPSSACTQTPLTVSSAASDGGFAYIVLRNFGTPADNNNSLVQSTLRFFENGTEMGPAHARHVDIRNLGAGRFSHWSSTNGTGEALRLSASNNSDPRTNGKSYTYCVPAAKIPVADTTPPTVPTGLTAVASASQVSLSWNASTDAVGVAGYRVYRNGTQIAAPASNSYADGNLLPGTYSYTVAGVDAAGNVSAQSGIVSATIASPLLPPSSSRLRLDMPSPLSFNVTREEETYRICLNTNGFPVSVTDPV